MNKKHLIEIKRRLSDTTPGKWVTNYSQDELEDPVIVTEYTNKYIAQTSYDGLSYTSRPTMYADAEFIAHSKEDIEYLLKLVDQLD